MKNYVIFFIHINNSLSNKIKYKIEMFDFLIFNKKLECYIIIIRKLLESFIKFINFYKKI